MSGSDKFRNLQRQPSGNESGSLRVPGTATRVSQLMQNFGGSAVHTYGGGTSISSGDHKPPGTNSRASALTGSADHYVSTHGRHSEHLHNTSGRDRDAQRSHSPNANLLSGSSANSGSRMHVPSDKNFGHLNPSQHGQSSSSQQSSRSSTGPVKVPPSKHTLRERSMSADSDSGATSLHFEGGAKGRMHDVEDDQVLISISNGKTGTHGTATGSEKSKSSDQHSTLPSDLSGERERPGGEEEETQATPTGESGSMVDSGKELKAHQALKRQGSGPYSSEEIIRSGQGIIGQPQSFESLSRHKVLPGEDSIGLIDYQKKISRSSSSSSSFDKVHTEHIESKGERSEAEHQERREGRGRLRRDSSSEELKRLHDEQVTALTKRLSSAEDVAKRLKMEKEKLERKLKETEEVAAQTELAAVQVSHLDTELKEEKEKVAKMMRDRSVSPESSSTISLKLSQELDIVKARLAYEVEAKAALEEKLSSLVVPGKGDGARRNLVISELQEKVSQLEKALQEKESESKKQTQVHSRTIADLQTKLSRERQQRQEILQSTGTKPTPTSSEASAISPDSAAMTEALREKDRTIQHLSAQLQKFEKTARDVMKITQHSKQQSGTIVALKEELERMQESLAEKEASLKNSHEEMNKLRTQYDSIVRKGGADLAQRSQQLEQLRRDDSVLKKQVSELSASVQEGEVRRTEMQSSLEKTQKEKNHWQQKSVQQDMVLQTTRQDVDRLHREVNGLNSTVAAQGKEVERLQRENQTLQGEIETHRITAMTYKEDFESERKDREAVHAKIAEMENRYRHQLEALGGQLQNTTDELKRHKDTLANTEELLQRQRQQMTAQLQQKENELHAVYGQKQQLQEDVMSKTQQVKQYKKQIDQLSGEVATYKEQAAAHMRQIEFLAQKTENLGKQRTLKELQEKKLVELEGQCDSLRAENNELRHKLGVLLQQMPSGSADASRSRPPVVKSQTVDGSVKRQPDRQMPALPNPAMQARHGMGRSFDEEQLQHRSGGGSSRNYPPPRPSHETGPPPNSQHQRTAPYSALNQNPGMIQQGRAAGGGGYYNVRPENLSTVAPTQGMGTQPNKQPNHPLQLQRQDSLYSSLPSSGLGAFGQQRAVYAQDDTSLFSAGEPVDKDSPPNSNIGQTPQPQHFQSGPSLKAHSQMLSISNTGNAQRFPPPHGRPPQQGTLQPLNNQLYGNLPLNTGHSHNTVPPNSGGQQRLSNSVRVGSQGQPSTSSARPSARPSYPHDVSSLMGNNQQSEFSKPVEESRRFASRKPQLGGYVKPQQASSHPVGGRHLAVDPLAGRAESHSTSDRGESAANAPKQGSISPSPSTGDISKGIDTIIEQTASKMREDGQVVAGEGEGEGIPYDPNLVCPKCRMRFREGEIQKFRRHVSSAHK